MQLFQIYTTEKEISKAKEALSVIEELKDNGIEPTSEQLEAAIADVSSVLDKIEVENHLKVMSPKGYDLTKFCNLIENQCPPSLLSAFCTHSQAELAGLMRYVDKKQIKSESGADIWELFNGIAGSLTLCNKFLGSIYDTVAGNLPLIEGEEAEKFKSALVFANSPAIKEVIECLKVKYNCETYEELSDVLKAKTIKKVTTEN
jgi:hypothetical protein